MQSNFQWLPYSIHFPRSQFYTRESGRDWPLSAISTLPSPIFCKAFPPPSPRPWWSWACCFNSYCISFYQNLSLNGTLLERNPCFFKPFFPSKLSTAIFGRDVFSGEYFSGQEMPLYHHCIPHVELHNWRRRMLCFAHPHSASSSSSYQTHTPSAFWEGQPMGFNICFNYCITGF